MAEIWKDIKNYENLYKVSNIGRVKSVERYRKGKSDSKVLVKERILKFKIDKDGYYCVSLSKDNILKSFRLPRLVAEAFIPNPHNYPQVNHIDEDKTNNRVENLEWVDCKQNINHSLYQRSTKIEYNGIIYNSMKECSRISGIGYRTIRYHIVNNKPYKGSLFMVVNAT